MQKLFQKYNIELEKQELEKFQKFLEIFKEKNSQINLSAIRDDEGIIEKHFIDSIMLNIFLDFNENLTPNPSPNWRGETAASLSRLEREFKGEVSNGEGTRIKIADLGTGGGFPLIPLAITNPEVEFIGIDSVGKKLKAIEEFAETLDLKNIKTLNGRAEEIGQNIEFREQFDFVVSRATAFLPTLLEYAIPLLKVGGLFVAYKLNDKEELQSSKKALQRLNSKIYKVKNYKIGDQDRTFVIIEKLEKTPAKYPRKNGIPLAKPLI